MLRVFLFSGSQQLEQRIDNPPLLRRIRVPMQHRSVKNFFLHELPWLAYLYVRRITAD